MERLVGLARDKIQKEIDEASKNKVKFLIKNKHYIGPLVDLSKKAFLKIQPAPEVKVETKRKKKREAQAKKKKVLNERLETILSSNKTKKYKNKKA